MFNTIMAVLGLIPLIMLLWLLYQPAHDWCEGSIPLTKTSRRKFEARYLQIHSSIEQNFLHRDRLEAWQSAAHCPSQTWFNRRHARLAINSMLKLLEDKYTRVLNRAQVKSEDRARIARNVAYSRMFEGGIGYIKLSTFHTTFCSSDLQRALKSVQGAEAFILDLRFNRGGFLAEAFECFGLFVDEGLLATIRGWREGKAFEYRMDLTATECVYSDNSEKSKPRLPNLTGNRPLVVLVNEDSASASELLAGALRQRPHTTIMGGKTFGKGVGQVTADSGKDWLLKVTSFFYYLPTGECVNGEGITPDIEVPACKCCDYRLTAAKQFLSKKLKEEQPAVEPLAIPLAASARD